jgi:uncharacterized protein YsxB (DUF464 family)
MTEITVVRNDDGDLEGFVATGHSLNAPAGRDIVCASISTLLELISSSVEDLPQPAISFHQSTDPPRWELVIDQSKIGDRERWFVRKLFRNTLETFRRIEAGHPEDCTVQEQSDD